MDTRIVSLEASCVAAEMPRKRVCEGPGMDSA